MSSPAEAKPRVAILISGRGSNMQALVRAMQSGAVAAEPALVLSDDPEAPGLMLARAQHGLPVQALPWMQGRRREWEQDLSRILAEEQIGWICLAGFMRLLSGGFVQPWLGRILNIHPSLLPAFPGREPHAQALEAGVAEHGASVHFVDAGMDTGPVIAQARLQIRPGESEERLAGRVLALEHRLYPQTLALVLAGRAQLGADGRAMIDGAPGPVLLIDQT